VSIIARGRALGWTLALPTEDKNIKSRSELRDELAMLLGGRTAEELIFGDPTTGAANDIERATQIAHAMVTQYGMSDLVGPQQVSGRSSDPFAGKDVAHDGPHSNEVSALVDAEIRRLLDEAHEEAREILALHRPTLDRLAQALVDHETLGDRELAPVWAELDLPGNKSGLAGIDGPRGGPARSPSENVTAAEAGPGSAPDGPDTGPPHFHDT
jgi:cell division protease FtsH